jgi:[ribosomal protein S18]-alanine N-acetyltransferase
MNPGPARFAIRRMDEADLDAITGIAEALAEAPHWPRQFYVEALNAESARERIALVVSDGQRGELVGFAVAGLVPPEAELETIAVAAHLQRCGIGRQLLGALASELRKAGIRDLLLEVRSSNAPAQALYRSMGFHEAGRRARYYTDPQEDAVLMSLHLLSALPCK